MGCENSEKCSCKPEPATTQPEVLNLKEAAELLRVKVHTMYYLLEHGQLKGCRVGKEYRFRRSALLAWLEAGGGAAA
ncbi:helix-turn-helix domain-containing protein [Myxococcota bacterium]|nr:helix-turn-helix domain-containing protein [Myxococcota bacterium]